MKPSMTLAAIRKVTKPVKKQLNGLTGSVKPSFGYPDIQFGDQEYSNDYAAKH